MLISAKGRYALRMAIDLAQNDVKGVATLKEMAKRQQVSVKYLKQIVKLFCQAGVIERCPGGYKLTKSPEKWTAGDILKITEGSMAPVMCIEDVQNQCPHASDCAAAEFWKGLYDAVTQYTNQVTLAQLASRR